MRARIFVLFVLLLTESPGADQRLALQAPTVMLTPGHLIVETVIQPDPSNRSIRVTTESASLYRSSEVELEGVVAPRRNTFEFRDLPTGSYEVRGLLLDAKGDQLALVVQKLEVISRAR